MLIELETESTQRYWEVPEANTRFHNANDADVRELMRHVDGGQVAVQAGGYMGIWPVALSEIFDQVYTFEADPVNYACLSKNVVMFHNVNYTNAALGCREGRARVTVPRGEEANFGAKQLLSDVDGAVQVITIDSLGLPACDLIYLDIEGWELPALRGAENVIESYQPVIGFEHKHSRAPEPWLRERGYEVLYRSKLDTVMVPP